MLMAVVTFSLKDLKDSGISIEALKDLVPRIGMEIEAASEDEVAIDITPNRPDLLDFTGLIRALNFFSEKKVPKENGYTLKDSKAVEISVTKNVSKIRPYIVGLVARKVDLSGDKLKYLINFTEKLSDTYGRKRMKFSTGIYNLDLIKGNLTYDAAKDKPFAPLGFQNEMGFSEILEKHPKGIAYGSIVKDSTGNIPFLSDSEKVLSMIPITNSESTKVTNATKNLFIDVTGTSLASVQQVANLLACSLLDSGAEVSQCMIKYDDSEMLSPRLEAKEVQVKGTKISKTLGIAIDLGDAITMANKMGHSAARYGNTLLVKVPPYRLDVLNDQDIIEDLAIGYGYDNISPLPIMGFSDGLPEELREFTDSVALFMVGSGFSEALNTYLTNERINSESMRRAYKKGETVGIAYAKTENITMLRTDILPCLLKSLSYSAHEKMPQKLFEIGSVFSMDNSKPLESHHLAFVSEHSKADFSEAKSTVLAILNNLGIRDLEIKKFDDKAFIEGRCAQVASKGRHVAVFGELHPAVLSNFNLEEPTIGAEVTLIDRITYGA
jgi:phenylalanyl-tRNA synthetase beta chain